MRYSSLYFIIVGVLLGWVLCGWMNYDALLKTGVISSLENFVVINMLFAFGAFSVYVLGVKTLEGKEGKQ